MFLVVLWRRDISRDEVELSNVGEYDRRSSLWRVLRRVGGDVGVDPLHRGVVEGELFKDVVLGSWTPRFGDSGE